MDQVANMKQGGRNIITDEDEEDDSTDVENTPLMGNPAARNRNLQRRGTSDGGFFTNQGGHQNRMRRHSLGSGGVTAGLVVSDLEYGPRSSLTNDIDLRQDMGLLYGSTLMYATYLQQQSEGVRTSSRPSDFLRASSRRLTESLRLNVDNDEPADNVFTRILQRLQQLEAGSLKQSVIIAVFIAIVNGIGCFLYYEAMEFGLDIVWKSLPVEWLNLDQDTAWWWIPLVNFVFSLLLGLTVILMGEPGDMPFTVACVHRTGYIPIDHVLPMVFASYFSILSGGSLGPEAPLVAIAGSLAGWISQSIFGQTQRNVVRKHTLMGMAGALAAFFGAPMGGSLFALEINSRFGIEYYEHLMESILCGELTMLVFRCLTRLPLGPIWDLNGGQPPVESASLWSILVGIVLGLIGAGMAYFFALFHSNFMVIFSKLGLLDNSRAIQRAVLGSIFVSFLGLTIPHTLFWSEEEIQITFNRGPTSDLPHVWPSGGWSGIEMDTVWKTFGVGFMKLIAISFSLAQGCRGGFIFPLFLAGGTVGRALGDLVGIPAPIATLCVAGACNTAITRTAFATTLILVFLAGEMSAAPAVLIACLTSLLSTGSIRFIKTQIARADVDFSLYHKAEVPEIDDKIENDESS